MLGSNVVSLRLGAAVLADHDLGVHEVLLHPDLHRGLHQVHAHRLGRQRVRQIEMEEIFLLCLYCIYHLVSILK